MKPLHILPLLLCALFFATTAAAQDFGQDFTRMAPFTKAELQRFLKDWPAFTEWSESKGEELDQTGNEDDWTREAAKFVSGLGWDHERFFYVAHQCAVGISGLTMEDQGPALQRELEETRRQIMADQTMTTEQKQQMLAMLEQSQGGMEEMRDMQEQIPSQEMALIKANENEIRRVMQAGE